MFLFRKKLRNESKIVFVFETFFFFQTNARNKIFLGWHAWQPYYRPGFYNKFVRGDFRKCRKWSLPEKPGTFCRILRQIAQYVTEGMALKMANVSTSCLHFFCVCTTGRQKLTRCGQSSWDNNCFGLLQIFCFKKNVWQRFMLFFRQCIIVASTSSLTSILASLVIFSILGHMAFVQSKDISDVATSGKMFLLFLLNVLFGKVCFMWRKNCSVMFLLRNNRAYCKSQI